MLRLGLLFFPWFMVAATLFELCCVAVVSLTLWMLWSSLYLGVWCKFSLTHRLCGVISPCCELCSLIMFWDCCFPNAHWFRWDCIICLGVFPPVIVFVVMLWGCCRLFGVVLATIGPRTTQESFPLLAVIADWLPTCNGWSSECVGSKDGGLVCLINLVCLETTQT